MRLKPGVRVLGIKPEILIAMNITDSIMQKHGVGFVVTSAVDGQHSPGSKHYAGLAFDMRIRHLTNTQTLQIKHELSEALGESYDVVLEKTHIHVEFDPKIPL